MGQKIIKTLKKIVFGILDIIYPEEDKCICCKAEEYIGICDECLKKIKRVETQDKILTYGFYGGNLKKLILQMKYNKSFTAAKILSGLLIDLIEENNIKADIICYVPMSKSSKVKRGFNQCEVLAENISREIGIPLSKALIKVKNTREQKTLSKEERMKNIQGAFGVRDNLGINDRSIILIDDVVTTGATIIECEKILKKYGANKITILTIAKSNI